MRRFALAGLVVSVLAAQPATAQESPVAGPREQVGGRTLAQWQAAWSSWDFGLTEKALAAEKECLPQPQPTPVRFLRIPESEEHVTTVTCTVPAGTWLMLGEPEVFCTDIDLEREYPRTAGGLKQCALDFYRRLADPHPRLVLDGRPIANGYVVRTSAFRFRLRAGNYLGVSPRRARAAVVAHPALVRPLPPGEHTLIQGVRYRDTSNNVCVFKLTVLPEGP